MSKQLIAKIILHTTGNVHIMMSNYMCVYATLDNVLSLISDPYNFIEEGYKNYEDSKKELKSISKDIYQFQGLVLGNVYGDCSAEIIYPSLFELPKPFAIQDVHKKINLLFLQEKTRFKDRKELYLKVYLDNVYKSQEKYTIGRNIPFENTSDNSIENIVSVIAKSPDPDITSDLTNNKKKITSGIVLNNFIPAKEYCNLYKLSYPTLMNRVKNGKLSSAVKHNGMWYIDKNEKYEIAPRKGRKPTIHSRLKLDTYEDVQKAIEQRFTFTSAIRKFIRNFDEAFFYNENNYHEVCWNGKAALIVDINPEYFCPELSKTNRELILSGLSPVIPNTYLDDKEIPAKWHLHHIGQIGTDDEKSHKSSPFAIINEKIHISREYFSIFHGTPSNENVHNKAFEIEKKSFWLTYLSEYDKAGEYYNIPYLNHRSKTKKLKSIENEKEERVK